MFPNANISIPLNSDCCLFCFILLQALQWDWRLSTASLGWAFPVSQTSEERFKAQTFLPVVSILILSMIVKNSQPMINWLNKTITDKFCQTFYQMSVTCKKTIIDFYWQSITIKQLFFIDFHRLILIVNNYYQLLVYWLTMPGLLWLSKHTFPLLAPSICQQLKLVVPYL